MARIAGEIESVKRMQSAAVPSAEEVFRGERRFELFAIFEPAREVGGDLCDFYRLDDDHVLIVVADVAGKGLSAGFFAHASKVLIKSVAMRGRLRLDELVQEVDRDISRDNPESLFVTAFFGLLDAKSGQLTYCGAGCQYPILVSGDAERVIADIAEAEGPPLCAIENFKYTTASMHLKPGDTLCVFTDGVTEAMDQSGNLYGRDALKESVRSVALDGPIRASCEALISQVKAFMSGAEPADDTTLLLLRWNGVPGTA
jgi:adenylate cyclase